MIKKLFEKFNKKYHRMVLISIFTGYILVMVGLVSGYFYFSFIGIFIFFQVVSIIFLKEEWHFPRKERNFFIFMFCSLFLVGILIISIAITDTDSIIDMLVFIILSFLIFQFSIIGLYVQIYKVQIIKRIKDYSDEESQESLEDEIYGMLYLSPKEPSTLEWEKLYGYKKNYIRLRLNITKENISDELIEYYRNIGLPKKDMPEIIGLFNVLDIACKKSGIKYNIEKPLKNPFFEPFKINLPFKKAKLRLNIADGEIQWIAQNFLKYTDEEKDKIKIFQDELLSGTKKWLERGNR